jgi:hypothetical protein
MSVELWKWVFDWAAVILVGLTFLAGAGALITGNIISKRQSRQLEQFNKDIIGAKTEMGRQQERAANAERELIILQERTKQRHISPDQERILTATLRSAPHKGHVTILCVFGDVEGVAFASQIDSILKASGWQSSGVFQDGEFAPSSIEGLAIVHNPNTNSQQAKNIRRAFLSAGVNVRLDARLDVRADTLRLMVGNKH